MAHLDKEVFFVKGEVFSKDCLLIQIKKRGGGGLENG